MSIIALQSGIRIIKKYEFNCGEFIVAYTPPELVAYS
jgi:hypothetical protein